MRLRTGRRHSRVGRFGVSWVVHADRRHMLRRVSTTAFDLLFLGDCNPGLILSGDRVEPTAAQPTLGDARSALGPDARSSALRAAESAKQV